MESHHRRTVLVIITSTLVVLSILSATLVTVFYQRLDANLHTGQAITHQTTKKQRGPKTPLNILVMGLDTRACPGCGVDGETGADGSDTTILMHISADRKTAYGISIPRDALVDPVSCTADHHYVSHGVDTGKVQWNAAFAAGGADCTAEQLEKNFGVYLDGYLTINFGGFKGMVNALGGVDACIPFTLSDPVYAKVTFEPGAAVHLNGSRALDYVRLRHVLDGSDLGRMKRQQAFISEMIDKAKSSQTLTRPDKLVKFADALTGSITASPELASVKKLINLAKQIRTIDLANIHFITVPNQVYDVPTTDPYYGRVKILGRAALLWQRVINDEPLSAALTTGSITAGPASPGPTPTATTATPTVTPRPTSPSDAARYGLCD